MTVHRRKREQCFKCGTFGHIATKYTQETKGKMSREAKEINMRCDLTRVDDWKTYKMKFRLYVSVSSLPDFVARWSVLSSSPEDIITSVALNQTEI